MMRFRVIAFIFIIVLLSLFLLRGKSYYTLGIYPMLFSAGAVAVEQWGKTNAQQWTIRGALIGFGVLVFGILSPISIPYLKMGKMLAYCKWAQGVPGLDGTLRWEDGELHHLPQDFADMLGWEELGTLVGETYTQLPTPSDCVIYCENFGQAGAVNHFGKAYQLPSILSFADSYRLWIPEKIPDNINIFIYVNDELGEDVRAIFEEVKRVGEITNPNAREYQTGVYLCTKPRTSFPDFWNARVREVLNGE